MFRNVFHKNDNPFELFGLNELCSLIFRASINHTAKHILHF